jgi:hypothetical protein
MRSLISFSIERGEARTLAFTLDGSLALCPLLSLLFTSAGGATNPKSLLSREFAGTLKADLAME